MAGKCHPSASTSGDALRKVGVKKASELLLDFRGRKSFQWDLDTVSEPTINNAPEGHAEIANGASPSGTNQSLVHFHHHGIPRGNTELPSDIICKVFLRLFYVQINLVLKSSNLNTSIIKLESHKRCHEHRFDGQKMSGK